MAVVTKYGKGYKDPTSIALPDPAKAEGRNRCISSGPVAIANGDSAASKIYFGKIPSHAVPLVKASELAHDAITTMNSLHIGLEKDGVVINNAVFASALDLTAAGVKNPYAAITVANRGKKVWELLGLTKDPATEYDIVGLMNAAATAAGNIALELLYTKK